MLRVIIVVLVICAVFAGVCFLQACLSKQERRWPGLVLPAITFFVSILYVLSVYVTPGEAASTILLLIFTFLYTNISTGILLAIYFVCREKRKKQRELEKMSVQDLK